MNGITSRLNCLGLCKKTSGDDEQKREAPPSTGCLKRFFLNPVVLTAEAFTLGTIAYPLEKIACENSMLNCTTDQIGVGSIPWVAVLAVSVVSGGMLFISYACYCCNPEKSHHSRDTYSDTSLTGTDQPFDSENESDTFSSYAWPHTPSSTPGKTRVNPGSDKKDDSTPFLAQGVDSDYE